MLKKSVTNIVISSANSIKQIFQSTLLYGKPYGTKMEEQSGVHNHPDVIDIFEYIKDRLYFATLSHGRKEAKSTSKIHFFTIDDELIYNNFYNDFGPLNIACLYRYCWKLGTKLNSPTKKEQQIVHYTCQDSKTWTNAAYLISGYAVLYLNKKPKDIYDVFMSMAQPRLKLFCDASMGPSIYRISLLDCLNAIERAAAYGFFNFEDFDIIEYEKYDRIEHGCLNWILPKKFLAFLSPCAEPDTFYNPPETYVEYFLQNEVSAVVRLNKKTYDPEKFLKSGIMHYDLFMPDGTVPPRRILHKFLHLAESQIGAIAVHCKAGLGRTGTLIGAYLIKHYQMPAKQVIAWLRICRPGSVIGHQQSWLEKMQNSLMDSGHQFKLKYFGNSDVIIRHKRGIYSLLNKHERQVPVSPLNTACSFSCPPATGMETTRKEDKGKSSNAGEKNQKYVLTQGDRLNKIKFNKSNLGRGTGPLMDRQLFNAHATIPKSNRKMYDNNESAKTSHQHG